MSRVSKKPKTAPPNPKQVQTTTAQTPMTSFKPIGEAPKAVVVSRHETSTITRQGRGFSVRELSAADMNFRKAAAHGIQIDIRRRSVLDTNVTRLKSWFQPTKGQPKVQKAPRAVKEKAPKEVKEKKAPRAVKRKKVQKTKPVQKTKKSAVRKTK